MEAAFVEIGLEKNGFLYVDEIVGPELEGKRHGRRIQDLLSRGQEILVQAVKDPMKTKGARLTTEISLPGRFVVYVPQGEGIGVSRRLEDDERIRLRDILKSARPAEGRRDRAHGRRGRVRGGHRARHPLPGEDLEGDPGPRQEVAGAVARLQRGRAAAPRRPRPVHRRLRAGAGRRRPDAQAHHRLPEEDLAAHGRARRALPREGRRCSRRHGVEAEIRSTLIRRVDLPSGGYLVFDYAEAFTVIDVNTGRFVGSRSKTSTRAPRGHDHEEQPRGREGGRPPAPPPRHRRDHRHRLHRHGQPEEPGARSRRS